MATREYLKKLNIKILRQLAADNKIDTKNKRKDDIISILLETQVPVSSLTPVRASSGLEHNVSPNENLPPFNVVEYSLLMSTDLLPTLSFTAVYDFMISRTRNDGKCVQNFKGLDKSVRHFEAGDIQEMSLAKIDETTTYIKAYCLASMKKQRYQVFICMTDNNGIFSVDFAYCQCPIGLAQACSHIGGLLFAVCNGKRQGQSNVEAESCTSTLCVWKEPRKINEKPKPLSLLNLSKPKVSMDGPSYSNRSVGGIANFDPRHSEDRSNNLERSLSELTKLKTIFPQTGMSCLWNIPDHTPDVYEEVELHTDVDPMFFKMEKMLFTENNLPPLEIDEDLVTYIEQQTRQQRLSDMWKKLHVGRLTSSLFAEALNAKEKPQSLIRTITEGSSLDRYANLPDAVQWGVDNESKARDEYVQLKKILNHGILVEPTGLTLCSTHSFLGASSDGKVTDENCTGLLEIKCPFSVDGLLVNKMEVPDILCLNTKSFCLEATENGPSLKKTHKYYAQVQGEMAVMGMPWCDFVVWTGAPKNNICVDRIYFDPAFVSLMMPKLVKFYLDHIFPIFYK